MDCGPTSLRIIAQFYGKSYSLQNLREKCHISRESVSLPGISDEAEQIGLRSTGVNPSCPKCAKVHEELASLNDYRINLVFVVNEGDEHSHQAALMMISAGIEHEWDVADRIIRDWYAHKKLPAGFQPHPCAAEHLEQQKKYCQQIHLEGTPTVLVDNRRLPEIYDIEDLKVLL